MLRRSATLLFALLFVVTVSACGTTGDGDEESDTTTTTEEETTTTEDETTTTEEETTTTEDVGGGNGGDDEAVCNALRDVADAIRDVTAAPGRFGSDWGVLQPELLDLFDQGLQAYREAADAAPDEIKEDLETIRDNVEENIVILEDSTSLSDFETDVSANASEITDEATRVNAFSKDTCGFPTVPGG